ncbi:Origin recognition complex subunit 3 [Paramarasmius palmivorus]|uniref:Origin recognition complex subunit 3 n=1 Tax=Paramarasmius palmivorus TaxID=297713 RepID=A0AAW0DDB2_9AGAR
MSPPLNFDDPNQSVCFIPYNDSGGYGPNEDFNGVKQVLEDTINEDEEKESKKELDIDGLADGEEIRWKAYRGAWTRCLNRMQELLDVIYKPVVAEVVEHISTANQEELPGLPYSEVPVITLTSPSMSPVFAQQVLAQLEAQEQRNIYTAHLHPQECTNLTSTLKSLIATFTANSISGVGGYKTSGQTLAAYDIRVLDAWYQALLKSYRRRASVQLIVVLHGFEQFDPAVMQDLLYICSLYISRIPLVFMITSTLTLLRIQNFTVPSGNPVLEKILLNTFASTEFEPDLVLGPAVLESTIDSYVRHNPSFECLVDHIQLAHLKHFSTIPLSALLHNVPDGKLEEPSSFKFLEHLVACLHVQDDEDGGVSDWKTKSVGDVVRLVDDARTNFYMRARKIRLVFALLRLTQHYLEGKGHKGFELPQEKDLCPRDLRLLIKVLRGGGMDRMLKQARLVVSKMTPPESSEFQANLKTFCDRLPAELHDEGHLVLGHLDCSANEVAEGLIEFMNSQLEHPLYTANLWPVWYTGESPFPSETLNPSVRASVISGLLRPKEFTLSSQAEPEPDELWERPDTSILFARYLESGKMINVYDWFDSFHQVLENQRSHLRNKRRQRVLAERNATPGSPRKRGSPRKSGSPTKKSANKGKQKDVQQEEVDELDEEQWRMQVHARFIRALHELDYLGFIKHTKRKQDHVLRTVFDVSD